MYRRSGFNAVKRETFFPMRDGDMQKVEKKLVGHNWYCLAKYLILGGGGRRGDSLRNAD